MNRCLPSRAAHADSSAQTARGAPPRRGPRGTLRGSRARRLDALPSDVGARRAGLERQGASVAGASLAGASLARASLHWSKPSLEQAFTGASLAGTSLAGTSLAGASLAGTSHAGTDCTEARSGRSRSRSRSRGSRICRSRSRLHWFRRIGFAELVSPNWRARAPSSPSRASLPDRPLRWRTR